MRLLSKILRRVLIGILLAMTLFPIYWMVITSVKPRVDFFKLPPDWIPKTLTSDHYYAVLASGMGVS